jgi:hypothetical protein
MPQRSISLPADLANVVFSDYQDCLVAPNPWRCLGGSAAIRGDGWLPPFSLSGT